MSDKVIVDLEHIEDSLKERLGDRWLDVYSYLSSQCKDYEDE